jgi:hypothetical protein
MISYCVHGSVVFQNQHDSSSVGVKRPDTVIEVRGALVLKGEAKYEVADISQASEELIEKLHPIAFKVFPAGQTRVLGVASTYGVIQLHFIDYDGIRRKYSSELFSQYNASMLHERVRFLVDLFKLMRWMCCVSGPNANFHLLPGIRRKTRNGHHVTWIRDGLLKEYNHRRHFTAQLSYINKVYTHRPQLPHVEYGYVNNDPNLPNSCVVTRIGNKLTTSTMARLHVGKEMVIAQVQSGLDELHNIGLAHCDLCIENVYIDDDGTVFLDDLEYLTPIENAPPHITRIPYGTDQSIVTTALILDELQYQTFLNNVISDL